MNEVWLAAIAVAVLVMAAAQVVVALHATRLARRASETAEALRRELRPILDRAHRMTDDAARAASLALGQVERIDQAVTAAARRIDETIGVVQHAIVEPVRQGAAVVAGLRAALAVIRGMRGPARPARDDDEALFIG